MKILLLGKTGQIGRELQRTMPALGDVISFGRADVDLGDQSALCAALSAHQPDVIVNAAGYTAVDQAESQPKAATLINTHAVATLARYAKRSQALLVQYSTDYVFDGSNPSPYTETDTPNPLNVYGVTKLAGEAAVLDSGCDALILRCSWVYATHGNNFPATILRLARTRETLSVVADQIGAPTAAALIADVTMQAVAKRRQQDMAGGIYHVAASGATSWHAYAQYLIAGAAKRGMPLRLTPERIQCVTSEDHGAAAMRPSNSRLDTSRLAAALGIRFADWTRDVDALLDQLVARGDHRGDQP